MSEPRDTKIKTVGDAMAIHELHGMGCSPAGPQGEVLFRNAYALERMDAGHDASLARERAALDQRDEARREVEALRAEVASLREALAEEVASGWVSTVAEIQAENTNLRAQRDRVCVMLRWEGRCAVESPSPDACKNCSLLAALPLCSPATRRINDNL